MFETFARVLALAFTMPFALSACTRPTSGSITVTAATPAAATQPLPLGRRASFTVTLSDSEHGVCGMQARLVQGAAASADLQNFLAPDADAKAEPKTVSYAATDLDLPALGLAEGAATLRIQAKNCSLFGGETAAELPVAIDFTAPRVALLSSQHYINRAGSDVALYSVSEDAAWSGVQVGRYAFKGYANPDASAPKDSHFAFFVYPHDLDEGAKIEIVARDAAGNEGRAALTPAKFFTKEFRKRDIAVDDEFIRTKIADIIANTPSLKDSGDNLKNFLAVNRDLRASNNRFLVDLASRSEEKFFWKDAFRPLVNASIEASFADYRTYYYNEEKVDEQVHLGFDMAVVERHPILAAAAGKVAFAGYLGIYGNTVVLDHGYGLMTLYAHMSAIDVKEGQPVDKDAKLGNSGMTGLAGGDHLHFSLLVQGVQANPVEFWDQHWIQDHVYLRLGRSPFGQFAAVEGDGSVDGE